MFGLCLASLKGWFKKYETSTWGEYESLNQPKLSSKTGRSLVWRAGFRLSGLGVVVSRLGFSSLQQFSFIMSWPRVSIYTTIMESGPERPCLLWFWGPKYNSITVVHMDPLTDLSLNHKPYTRMNPQPYGHEASSLQNRSREKHRLVGSFSVQPECPRYRLYRLLELLGPYVVALLFIES